MDVRQNRLVEERNRLQSGVGEPLEDYRTEWPHEQRVFDDYLFPKYRKELEIIRHYRDYNMPDGVLAQHFFQKDAYRWNYMSVLLDTYRRTSFEAPPDDNDRSHKKSRGSCLGSLLTLARSAHLTTRKFRISKSTMKAEELRQRRAYSEQHTSSEARKKIIMSPGLREEAIRNTIKNRFIKIQRESSSSS